MSKRITISDEELSELYKLLKAAYDGLPSGFNTTTVVSMGRKRISELAKKLGYTLSDKKEKS